MLDSPAPIAHRLAWREYIDAAALLALAGIALWLRWPALSTEGFHNEDAAGIAYNADLLRRGLVPMVDSLEFKAPASFFLSWTAWAVFGRSIVVLQCLAAAWSILAMTGVYVGARLLWGQRSAVTAALVYTVASPVTDSIDINYGTWMIAPYVWATVLVIVALRRGHWGWLVGAGIALAAAGLFKRQAAILFPLVAFVIAMGPRLEMPDGWVGVSRRPGLIAFFGGLAAGFAPMGLYYLIQGGFVDAYIRDYFLSESGWRYVKGDLDLGAKIERIGHGFLGLWEYMALPALLAALSMASMRARAGWTARGVLLAGHFWLSFAGAALGFRFFKGYYLQVLPAAAWLAAAPDGPLARWLHRDAWPAGTFQRVGRALVVLCFALALAPAAIADWDDLKKIRSWRKTARDRPAQAVAKIIRENTSPDDRIWVWGRWGWPIYFHADRVAATRYYKVLGVITTNLNGTWKRPPDKTRFDPSGPWPEIIADLEKNAPRFIAVAQNEDYRKFDAFKKLLASRYERVEHVDAKGFTLYRHQDHTLTKPPRPKSKKKPARRQPTKSEPAKSEPAKSKPAKSN